MDRIALLESGADQVISEGLSDREFAALVSAMFRVASLVSAANGDLPAVTQLRSWERQLRRTVASWPVIGDHDLTETERLLFDSLRSYRTTSRAELLRCAFVGSHHRAESSHLRVHLHLLRKKLLRANWTIQATYGRGYRLVPLTTPAPLLKPCVGDDQTLR